MAFLSAYDGTTTVHLTGNDAYWVELLDHVSQGGKENAERALQSVEVVGGKARPTPDVIRHRQLLLLAHVKEWNLDDEDGTVWPVTLDSVRRLPDTVFDQLWEAVEAAGAATPARERAQFHGEGVGGDPDGDGGSAVAVDVPAGSGAVEAAWPSA